MTESLRCGELLSTPATASNAEIAGGDNQLGDASSGGAAATGQHQDTSGQRVPNTMCPSGTLGALRELTAGLPDDTLVEVAIRREVDDFDFVLVDFECVDLTAHPKVTLTIDPPGAAPLVKGPTTFTTACTCDSQLPGYHRMDCGVYA